MASSKPELQPEPRISWPDYVDDTDTVFIVLHLRMSALVLHPEVSKHLSQLDQARYGKNDMDTAIEFCKFISALRNPNMFEGVFRFLAHEGVVAGIEKHAKDPSLHYPITLHVSLALHYTDAKLDKLLKPTLAAIYSNNSRFFPRCLPGTRVGLIDQVLAKITSEQPLDQPLLVSGSAGTGKSALAASVLQALKVQRIPVLSFVCKHDILERSDPQFVIPTLAWQLAKYPLYRSGVEEALRKLEADLSNPVDISPVEQVKILTMLPSLGSSLQRPVILVDALDECGQTASRKQLIKAFIDNADTLCPRFTVIIVSRPIDQIQRHVRPKTWTVVDLDELIQSDGTTADLKRFFDTELEELAPTSGEIKDLVVAANGLFVWARVACSYIILLYDPTDAKQALSGFCSGLAPAGSSEPLYDLYRRTLRDYLFAGSSGMPAQNLELFHQVISSILFTEVALSATGIAWLVDRSETAVESLLDRLRPLLAPRDGSSGAPVRLLHASVDDFFRSLDEDDKFFIPPRHARCFHRCFETMVEKLSFNFAGVTDPREVTRSRPDLENVRASVSEPLRYSCFQWAWHLSSLGSLDSASLKVVEHFFERVFLYWLELVGLFERVGNAAVWLQELAAITRVCYITTATCRLRKFDSVYRTHCARSPTTPPNSYAIVTITLNARRAILTYLRFLWHSDKALSPNITTLFFPMVSFPGLRLGSETSRIAPTLIHSSTVLSIEFSPISEAVLTVTESTIKIFDSISGAQITALTSPTSLFDRGYYSATGKMIVAHSHLNKSSLGGDHDADEDEFGITIWDTSSDKMTKVKTKNNPYTTGLSLRKYYPERNVALLKGNNKVIAVWDLESSSTRLQEVGELGEYGQFWASRDGSTVLVLAQATHSHNSRLPVELWRAATATDSYANMPLPVSIEADEIKDLAISCEGSKLAFLYSNGILLVVDLKLRSSLRIKTTTSGVYTLQFTANISRIVTLSYGNVVTAYDLTGTILWSSQQMRTYVLAVSRDGSRFAFVRYLDQSKVQICIAGQSTAESEDDSDCRPRSADFFDGGQQLLIVSLYAPVEQWNPLTGKRLTSLAIPFGFYPSNYGISPDGSLVAVVGKTDNASCLNTSTGNVIWNRTYPRGLLPDRGLQPVFSPNNAFLICRETSYSAYSLILLDAASGELLGKSVFLDGGLDHIAFSADSSRICGVHARRESTDILIWIINDSNPYLQLQAQSSSTNATSDKYYNSRVVWTAADTKVVTIASNSEPTLTCWDPETCARLATVKILGATLSGYAGRDLAMPASLVGPVFGGLQLPRWLSESADQAIENQNGVEHREITLLDRWRNLVFISSDRDDKRLAEHEYPDGSKTEVIRCSEKAIVIHYPSEDPWANFCKGMDGFKMPEGNLLSFFEVHTILATDRACLFWTDVFLPADQAKRNTHNPSTLSSDSEQDSTAEDPPSSVNDHPTNVGTSVWPAPRKPSAQRQSSAVATSSSASGFQMAEGKVVPIVEQARPNANEASTLFEEDSVGENLPYPVNDHHTDLETPARLAFNESGAQLTSLIATSSSHASINTLKEGQPSASKKQGWRERLGIKSPKTRAKAKQTEEAFWGAKEADI